MSDPVAAPAFPYKTQPYGPYQRDILKRSAALHFAYLAMEQGTGKTWEVINTAAYLYLKKKIDGMIVLAPNGVHAAWAYEQMIEHMPDVVPWEAHVWNSGVERAYVNKKRDKGATIKERRADWYFWELVNDMTKFPVLCVNSEAIRIALCKKAIGTMLTLRQCLFVVDEAGDFTTPGAARTRALMTWRNRAPYRRVLEGVPVGTSPFELYAPYRFLDPRILGYDTYAKMKEAHAEWDEFVKGGDSPDLTPDERAKRSFKVIRTDPVTGKKMYKDLDLLAKKIAPYTFRTTKAEALPWLPAKQFTKLFFSMTVEQWRLTNELREFQLAQLADGGTVTTQNVLTQYLRYQQIACGYVPPDIIYGEEQEPVSILPGPNPRLEMCIEELLRYNGAPTIIWTRFKFDIDLLGPRLAQEGFTYVTYDGRTKDADREAAKQRFQAGEVNVFLGNPAAGGRGLNLFRAEFEIFYANYFGLRRRLQAEDRGHRIGSSATQPVQIADLMGYRSIDMMIVRALRNNQEVADIITGDPAKEWI
jgi:SNF2 family DNA or RNA helicase